jgi:putative ABC transport system ATP-binding protein
MRDDTAEASPAILLDDVRLTLTGAAGPVDILRGVDLSVAKGEALGLVGPSGSGKSTLMMIVAGLEKAASGRVVVAGADLSALDEERLATFRRETIGIVFQSFHLIPTMTALENVAVPLELAGKKDALERAKTLLGLVGLGERLGHYPAQLSGGEQQRVAVARAFIANPPILLADEPTGNLDGASGRAVIDLLFNLRADTGTTLLLITHDANLASRCDRVMRIADGRIATAESATRS